MTVETSMPIDSEFLGIFSLAAIPPCTTATMGKTAYAWDLAGGTLMYSNGVVWKALTTKRLETYAGTSNASGDLVITFAVPFLAAPHVNPVCYPPADADTRSRVLSVTTTGCTIRTEKNNGLVVLGLTVLGFGTGPVASVPVSVLVAES